MRNFLQAINDYPLTSLSLAIFILLALETIKGIIRQ
jgi:hypothetical protein